MTWGVPYGYHPPDGQQLRQGQLASRIPSCSVDPCTRRTQLVALDAALQQVGLV